MRSELRVKRLKKKIISIILIAIFCIAIIGGFFIKNKYLGNQVVEAVDVVDTLEIIKDYNPVNVALKDEIKLIETKEANIMLNAKRKIIEEERIAKDKELEEIEAQRIEEAKSNGKIAYLTFDDGPSLVTTPRILEILEEYNIKATFFLIGYMAERYPEIAKMTLEKGHTIGNHTYSHNYGYIYRSPANFLEDLKKANDVLKGILGDDFSTNIVRFPGGSFGKEYLRSHVTNAGYQYFDWNSLNGDAEGINFTKERLITRFKETAKDKNELIILMHDTDAKTTTADALPDIIEFLLDQGYIFDVLDNYN